MNTDKQPKKVGIPNEYKLQAYREFSKTVGETIQKLNEQVKVLNNKIGAKGEVVEKKSGLFGFGGIFGGRKQQKSRKGGKKQRKQTRRR
jgi:hypothetical protein